MVKDLKSKGTKETHDIRWSETKRNEIRPTLNTAKQHPTLVLPSALINIQERAIQHPPHRRHIPRTKLKALIEYPLDPDKDRPRQ